MIIGFPGLIREIVGNRLDDFEEKEKPEELKEKVEKVIQFSEQEPSDQPEAAAQPDTSEQLETSQQPEVSEQLEVSGQPETSSEIKTEGELGTKEPEP